MRPNVGETICGRVRIDAEAPPFDGARAFGPPLHAHMLDDGMQLWLTVVERELVPSAVDLSRFMAGAHGLLDLRHPGLAHTELIDREADFCVVGCTPIGDVEGLQSVLDRGGGAALARRAAVELAEALAHLHAAGRVHGVLAPGNVLISRGAPILAQHGIAQLCDPKRFAMRARRLGGDVVAPEVDGARRLEPAADVYAWGAVVSAMLTGLDGADAVTAVLDGEAGQGALVDVVRHALEPDVEARISDAVELLRRLDASHAPAARPMAVSMSSPPARAPAASDRGRVDAFVPLEDLHLGEVEESVPGPHTAPVAHDDSESDPFGTLELDDTPLLTVPPPAPDDDDWDFEGGDRLVDIGPQGSSAPPHEDADASRSRGEWADTLVVDEPRPFETGRPPSPAPRNPPPLPRAATPAVPSPPRPPVASPRSPSPQSGRPKPVAAPIAGLDPDALVLDDLGDDPGSEPLVALPDDRARSISTGPPGVEDDLELDLSPEPPAPEPPRRRPAATPPPGPPTHTLGPPAAPVVAMPGVGEDDEDALLEPEPPPPPRAGGAPALAVVPSPSTPLEVARPEAEPSLRVASASPPSLALADDSGPNESFGGFGREGASLALDLDRSHTQAATPSHAPIVPAVGPSRAAAPPVRAASSSGPRGTGLAAVIFVVVTLVAVGLTLPVALHRGGLAALLGQAEPVDADVPPEPRPDAPTKSDAKAPTDAPPPVVAGKCPEDTVRNGATGDAITCIDAGEYPGLREIPRVEVTLADARSLCAERGRRLCSSAEWRRACSGPTGQPFPYGTDHRADACNEARPDGSGQNLSRSGARDGCRSEAGVFDLLGNVGEWVEEGVVLGGDATSKQPTCGSKVDARPAAKNASTGLRCCMDVPIR